MEKLIPMENIIMDMIDREVEKINEFVYEELINTISKGQSTETNKFIIPSDDKIKIIAYDKFKQQFKDNNDYQLIEIFESDDMYDGTVYIHGAFKPKEYSIRYFKIKITSNLYKGISRGNITKMKHIIEEQI